MTDCLFCSIIDGEIPSRTVYETENVLAFLDVNPVAPGHTLAIPKTHSDTIHDTSEDTLAAVHTAAKHIADTVKDTLDADGVNILQSNGEAAGQEINHLHVHIIPRFADDGFDMSFTPQDLDDDEMDMIQDQLQDAI